MDKETMYYIIPMLLTSFVIILGGCLILKFKLTFLISGYSEKYDTDKICRLFGWNIIFIGITIAFFSIIQVILTGQGVERIIDGTMILTILIIIAKAYYRRKFCIKQNDINEKVAEK